jgi:hypothetical protein
LGELLDRIFSIYRKHFWLFMGINALPQLLILATHLITVAVGSAVATGTKTVTLGAPPPLRGPIAPGVVSPGLFAVGAIVAIAGVVVYFVAYLFAQGGTVFAVSELYLGRPATVRGSLQRMRGHAGQLFGVSLLNGLAVIAGMILLIIPGIYVACRLLACVPAALVEDLGASESLSRSWNLTKGAAGRSAVIGILYFVLLVVALMFFQFPFTFAAGLTAHDPSSSRLWLELGQVGNFLAAVLVVPFFTIATAVYYLDLRVRKEALDLQLMMNAGAAGNSAGAAALPTMFPS